MTRSEFLYRSACFEKECFEDLKIKLICFTFWRSPEDQLKEFQAGRSAVTHGKHQNWLAKDYALFDDVDNDWICDQNEIIWKYDQRYQKMGDLWVNRYGGIWGGVWQKPRGDIYHFEG